MRQPLEERKVTISACPLSVDYPLQPDAGYEHEPLPLRLLQSPRKRNGTCAGRGFKNTPSKISGAAARQSIDLHVEVTPGEFLTNYRATALPRRSELIRERVIARVKIQR